MIRNALFALFLLFGSNSHGQIIVGVEETSVGARDRVLAVARASIGKTEKTGNNDGVFVDSVLASVGLEGTGAPYCAAFMRYCYDVAGLRLVGPRSALAAVWVSNPSWTLARGGSMPLPGDAWGIYFPSKGRVAHTGMVEQWGDKVVTTIEANTSPSATTGDQRNGDGCWRKKRLKNQLFSARNWMN
ncbi:MAG: CHAP domain-containing protein [Verrucomicrobiales bacterium]|nr:MAG: CHAP domain-containing protein [Verrucomicrobiales bacterium]